MRKLISAITEASFHLSEQDNFSPRTRRNLDRVGTTFLWIGYALEGDLKLRWREWQRELLLRKFNAELAEREAQGHRIAMSAH